MKRLSERELSPVPAGSMLRSIRVVMARMADVLWQADAAGEVTGVTPCRPTLTSGHGELDENEVRRVEQLWRRCVRCAERFSATYHVRSPDSSSRTFFVQALPVLNDRDETLYWSGSAGEVDRLADAGSQFITEATSVLSSSLNRATIVKSFNPGLGRPLLRFVRDSRFRRRRIDICRGPCGSPAGSPHRGRGPPRSDC